MISTYLTDYEWVLEKHSYATPNLDKFISSNALRLTNKNGEEVSYLRGIGAHSTSTIIYDLSDIDVESALFTIEYFKDELK